MYPMLCDGVKFRTGWEGRSELFFVQNDDGDEFMVSHPVYKALRSCDGTRPLRLPDHGESLLPELKRCGLVRTSRWVNGGLFNRFILFPVGHRAKKWRHICRIINCELSSICFVVIMIAFFMFTSGRVWFDVNDFNIGVYWGIIFLSMMLHEFGHMIAGIAYGYRIDEVGLLFLTIIPIGAYVAHDDKADRVKNEELQFTMAGIEVNAILAGLSVIGAAACEPLSSAFFSAALGNILLIIGNLIPREIIKVDGTVALNTLFEVDSIFRLARKCLRNRKRRRKLLRCGLSGAAGLVLSVLVLVTRYIYYMIIIGVNVYALFL